MLVGYFFAKNDLTRSYVVPLSLWRRSVKSWPDFSVDYRQLGCIEVGSSRVSAYITWVLVKINVIMLQIGEQFWLDLLEVEENWSTYVQCTKKATS